MPAQTSLSAPATTTEPAGVATRTPHDSVLEALVPAQVEYPDVFSAAVLNEDGSVRISYDESSSDAADFIDFVEANSSGDSVIDWVGGGLPLGNLSELAAEASAMAEDAGYEVRGGSLSADGSTYVVLSPRVGAERSIGVVSVGGRRVEIVVQGGDSAPEVGGGG